MPAYDELSTQNGSGWQVGVENQESFWIQEALGGDLEAFGRLVEVYQGPVFNLAYRILGSASEAEDAAQETFARMYTKLHTYQPTRKLSSWVFSIASHYCIDRLRRRRGGWLSLDDEPVALVVASRDAGPEEALLEAETRDEVQAMVSRLPPTYRAPLVLRYWYDMSYAEIAEVMGLTIPAVKSRLHRARVQMSSLTPVAGALPMTLAAVR